MEEKSPNATFKFRALKVRYYITVYCTCHLSWFVQKDAQDTEWMPLNEQRRSRDNRVIQMYLKNGPLESSSLIPWRNFQNCTCNKYTVVTLRSALNNTPGHRKRCVSVSLAWWHWHYLAVTPHLHLTTSKVMVIVWRLRGNIIRTVLYIANVLPLQFFNGHS